MQLANSLTGDGDEYELYFWSPSTFRLNRGKNHVFELIRRSRGTRYHRAVSWGVLNIILPNRIRQGKNYTLRITAYTLLQG
jgi:hypothetical protein